MVTEEQYIEYITKDEPACFFCGLLMGRYKQRVYQIKTSIVENRLPKSRQKILTFHESCFKEIAGEVYMIEELKGEFI